MFQANLEHPGAHTRWTGWSSSLAACPEKLVDHVSFELMRRRGMRSVLALDRDFGREGFDLVLSL